MGRSLNEVTRSLSPRELDWLADELAERIAERIAKIDPDPWGDIHQAAAWLGCSTATIERMVRAGEIQSHKFGKLRRFRRSELIGRQHPPNA